MVSRAALDDMEVDSLDLVDVLSDQVRRLVGAHGRTKKAIAIFGGIGQQNQVSEFAGSDSPLNTRLRRSRGPRTLTSIIIQDIGSLMETIATTILQMAGKCVRWTWNTFSANLFIILLLVSSIVLNLIFSSRGTLAWWQERKTTNLMSQLGIGPHQSMDRAIYIRDLGDAMNLGTAPESEVPQSTCKSTFQSLMNLAEPPSSTSIPASPQQSQISTALRVQRTRQHLGTRRHDLLVAMRVVNSIEKEMVRAEWERWLREESARCQQLGTLIKLNKTGEHNHRLDGLVGRSEEVMTWYDDYCGSCQQEAGKVMEL